MRSIWLGIDDTDSPRGGCTTWTLTEVLALAREEGLDLVGEPRLVRLNPNVPWKTRGNAALSARLARGRGPRRQVGEVEGRPLWSFARGAEVSRAESDRFLELAWKRVLASSRVEEPRTDPALVASRTLLPSRVYRETVQNVVDVAERRRFLERRGVWMRSAGDGRGVVGASAAIAWPGRRATWELIAYRPVEREGEARVIDAASVRAVATRHPSLFLCHDPRTRRLLVAPHTPCPILFGLRGTDPRGPLGARHGVRSEAVDRWLLYRTNQATGDHLVRRAVRDLGPYDSARVRATIVANPTAMKGGHVLLRARDAEGGDFEAIAFEPTKTLPRVARNLRPGDRVELWGGRAESPGLKLEGIRVIALAPRWGRRRPPRCPTCGRPARSLGHVRGFRCPDCRRTFPPEEAVRPRVRAAVELGTYHPTPSARRHLAPLAPES